MSLTFLTFLDDAIDSNYKHRSILGLFYQNFPLFVFAVRPIPLPDIDNDIWLYCQVCVTKFSINQ